MSELTAEVARSMLRYEPDTGKFYWIVRPALNVPCGAEAGYVAGMGYASIRIKRRRYLAHRLAWLMVTGSWPRDQIDHINHDRADNRFANLREATASQNCRNSRRKHDPLRGVCFVPKFGKWQAQIWLPTQSYKHLGYFPSVELAQEAYARAAEALQ